MTHAPGFFEGTEMPTAGWWEALWPEPAKVLAAVGMTSCMTVVDLCSGDGWFTLQIAKIVRRVIAIDIDGRLLDVARVRLAENGIANCDYVTGDAYDLATLVRHPVDFVFLANAFHGVPDRPRLARAVHATLRRAPTSPVQGEYPARALQRSRRAGRSPGSSPGSPARPGGRFAIVNWHQRPREETTILGEPRGPKTELRLSPDQTIAAVEAGGLKLDRLVELPPYHYGVVFERGN